MATTTTKLAVGSVDNGYSKMWMYLQVQYDASVSPTAISVTPYFKGNKDTGYRLNHGKVQYSTDGGQTKTDLFDFGSAMDGGVYVYNAPVNAGVDENDEQPITATIPGWPVTQNTGSIAHTNDAVTVTFYTTYDGGVSTAFDASLKMSGSATVELPATVTSYPVYIDTNGSGFEAYEVYIDSGSGWGKYRAYIDNGASWDPCG